MLVDFVKTKTISFAECSLQSCLAPSRCAERALPVVYPVLQTAMWLSASPALLHYYDSEDLCLIGHSVLGQGHLYVQ